MEDEIKQDEVVATPAGDSDAATTPVVPADDAVSTEEVAADAEVSADADTAVDADAEVATEDAADVTPEAPAAE